MLSKLQILFLLIFLCLLTAFNCISETLDNYFDRIAMVSNGRLTRFTEMPISVYVEGLTVQGKKYASDLRYALKEWEDCTDNTVTFRLTDSPDKVNILVSWVNMLKADDLDHPLGVAELQRMDGDKFRIEMRITLRDGQNHKPLTHEQIKTVLLHEFGHAIGLWGHSKNKADVMYYAANALHPTPRDINTLKMIYSHAPNYSLHAESITAIKRDMNLKPEDARLHFLLGTVYADQGDYSQAVNSLKKCLLLNPGLRKASAALASTYQDSGQNQAALAEYLSLAKSDPSAVVHNVIGSLYFESKDTAKAIEHFKKALKLERTYQPAKTNLCKIYVSKSAELTNDGMYQAAIALLLDGIRLFPDEPELHNSLGTAYAENKQFQKAISAYRRALQINPGFTAAKTNMVSGYNNQGVKYAKMGQWNEAIEAYNRALNLAPNMQEAGRNLSAAYWEQASRLSKAGRNSEAVEAYQCFLEREPNSKEAYNNLGTVCFRMDDYKSAVAAFKSAVRLDPEDAGLKANLAIAYHKQGTVSLKDGDNSQAITEFVKGLEITPDNVGLLLSLAQAYQRLRKWDAAARQIDRALILKPDNNAAHKMMAALNIHRGNDFLHAKKYDQALAYYNQVPADLAPPSLHNNIGYIYIMKDADADVRNYAARAVGKTRSAEAVPPLVKILQEDENQQVRASAAGSLEKLGKSAVDPLIKVLEGTEDMELTIRIVQILGNLGDKKAIKPLEKVYKETSNTVLKNETAKALNKI